MKKFKIVALLFLFIQCWSCSNDSSNDENVVAKSESNLKEIKSLIKEDKCDWAIEKYESYKKFITEKTDEFPEAYDVNQKLAYLEKDFRSCKGVLASNQPNGIAELPKDTLGETKIKTLPVIEQQQRTKVGENVAAKEKEKKPIEIKVNVPSPAPVLVRKGTFVDNTSSNQNSSVNTRPTKNDNTKHDKVVNIPKPIVKKSRLCFTPNSKAETEYLKIKKIEVTEEYTIFTMQFTEGKKNVVVYKPGHNDAFQLDLSRGNTFSKLQYITGIKTDDNVTVRANQQFKLFFKPLPENIPKIHLIEGRGLDEGTSYWNFKNIDLTCLKR